MFSSTPTDGLTTLICSLRGLHNWAKCRQAQATRQAQRSALPGPSIGRHRGCLDIYSRIPNNRRRHDRECHRLSNNYLDWSLPQFSLTDVANRMTTEAALAISNISASRKRLPDQTACNTSDQADWSTCADQHFHWICMNFTSPVVPRQAGLSAKDLI